MNELFVDCGNPAPTSGSAEIVGGTTFGNNATLQCPEGYSLIGDVFVVCESTGWNGSASCTILGKAF